MSKILYSAVDRRGRPKNGYIDAATNEAALQELSSAGYTSVQFHDDGSTSFPRDWLKDANQADLEAIASIEIKARQQSGFGSFMLDVFQNNKWSTLIGLGLAAWGLAQNNPVWIVFGAVTGLTVPLISAWNYRIAKRFDDMLLAFAEGRWGDTRSLIQSLRRQAKGVEMVFELDVRDAIASAENNSLESTIAGLEPWIKKLEDISPGLYALRVASVYGHYNRYDCVLELMREAYKKSPKSPIMTLDLAMAEVRVGDAARAEQLIESLDIETIPTIAPPFLAWVRALVQQGKGKADAALYFQHAISGMIELGAGATYLPSLAVCVSDYAAYCLDNNSMPGKVKDMLFTVWPVVRAHGDNSVNAKLAQAYPELASE